MTPADCHEQIVPFDQLVLEGISIWGLVNTGASVSCLAHSTWWQNQAMWPVFHLRYQVIRSANGKPLLIVSCTRQLRLEREPATGLTSFMVISGLASTLTLITMDLMIPLHLQRDVVWCTAILGPSILYRQRRNPPLLLNMFASL